MFKILIFLVVVVTVAESIDPGVLIRAIFRGQLNRGNYLKKIFYIDNFHIKNILILRRRNLAKQAIFTRS